MSESVFPNLKQEVGECRDQNGDLYKRIRPISGGLSKRELFAAMAMQGIMIYRGTCTPLGAAVDAVAQADALLAELGKEKG